MSAGATPSVYWQRKKMTSEPVGLAGPSIVVGPNGKPVFSLFSFNFNFGFCFYFPRGRSHM